MNRLVSFLLVIFITFVSLYGQSDKNNKKNADTSQVESDSLIIDSLLADTLRQDTLLKIDTVVQLDTVIKSDTLLKTLKGYVSSSSLTGSPVTFMNDTLFFVYAQIGPYTPDERAKSIMERLERISKDPTIILDSIKLQNEANFTNIIIGDLVLMSVTDVDARIVGLTHEDLALANSVIIKSTLYNYFEDTSFETLLKGGIFTLIATIVLIILLRLMSRYFPRFYKWIRSLKGTHIRGVGIQNLEFLSAERMTNVAIFFAKFLRLLLVLLMLYFYLPLVFSFFPWTRLWASKLIGYITSPLKILWDNFVDFLPNLFFILVAVIIARYFIKFIKLIFEEIEKENVKFDWFYSEWAKPTYNIVRFIIIIATLIIIFPYLPGSSSPAFQGISIFFGLLISLGSTSAVANVVAGVVLTYMRPFKIGDRVKIAETMGDVIEKNLLITRLKTIKNEYITIPNAQILANYITNYSRSSSGNEGLILHSGVTISYDVQWKKVHELLIAAAKETPDILPSPEPFVYQKSLDDFYVSYEINAYTEKPHLMARIYSDLHKNILDKFNEAGVEIMSPHFTGVRDSNTITIPPENIPKSYKPPIFKIFPFLDPNKGKGE